MHLARSQSQGSRALASREVLGRVPPQGPFSLCLVTCERAAPTTPARLAESTQTSTCYRSRGLLDERAERVKAESTLDCGAAGRWRWDEPTEAELRAPTGMVVPVEAGEVEWNEME